MIPYPEWWADMWDWIFCIAAIAFPFYMVYICVKSDIQDKKTREK